MVSLKHARTYFWPMTVRSIAFLLTLCVAAAPAWAQKAKKPVQLSGMVITTDSVPQMVPYAAIFIKKRKQGTTAGPEGFFSIPALPGDSIRFSSIGFMPETLVVPADLEEDSYLVRVRLEPDTTMLREVVLYPWPSPDRLKDYLLSLQVTTTEDDLARRNLALEELKMRAAAMGYDAAEIQDFVIRAQEQRIYNSGRYYGADGGAAILGALTNPFAWTQFFEALKSGAFR